MAQKLVINFRDEDSELGRSQIYLPDYWSAVNFTSDLAPEIMNLTGAAMESAQETDWTVIDPPAAAQAGPYDVRDKCRIDLLIHGPVGVMSLTFPAPMASIFVDSDHLPAPADLASYPVLEAAIDELIGTVTDDPTIGAAAAFGYLGGRRLRFERQ